MISRIGASSVAIAAVLFAQSATDVVSEIDIWKAVSELGIAIVFAVLGFLGMGWWIRRAKTEQREDAVRMATRITNLENFQQTKLLDVTGASVQANTEAASATRDNTTQLIRMTDALTAVVGAIGRRPCAAIESLPEKERSKVMSILRGRYEDTP